MIGRKILFIDRDGTIIREPEDEQIDNAEKFDFLPQAISSLSFLKKNTDYEFVMVSNQDGLGTEDYPETIFNDLQGILLRTLKSEGFDFNDIKIDKSKKEDNLPTRKPGTGMLGNYLDGSCNLAQCYVIGDRATDAQLAKNIGCKALILKSKFTEGLENNDNDIILVDGWDEIVQIVFGGERKACVERKTKETSICVEINLDGNGKANIDTGIGFFDHMLEQIARHGMIDLNIKVNGDLNVDEHHTIEDTGIVLGECIAKALGDKRGIERYGFCLPMDDCLCQVAIDFGGRPWLVWDTEFKREKIGDMPTEMFMHFFKSLSDNAKMNLNIKAEGNNEHHKIEGIFKALAKAMKMACKRDFNHFNLPSSKGTL